MRSQDTLIYVRTNYYRYIPELATSGPIVVPIKVPISRCVKMLSAGIELYEVDVKTGATVKLSITNIQSDNLFKNESKHEKFNTANPVEPTKKLQDEPSPVVVAKMTAMIETNAAPVVTDSTAATEDTVAVSINNGSTSPKKKKRK